VKGLLERHEAVNPTNLTVIPTWSPQPSNQNGVGVATLLAAHQAPFLDDLDITSRTRSVYGSSLRRFIIYTRERSVVAVTRSLLVAYREALLASGLSVRSVSLYLTPVRTFCHWLMERGLIPEFAGNVKGLRIPREYARDALSREQAVALLVNLEANATTLAGKRDFALISLLLNTGIRGIEAVRARIGDLAQREGRCVLFLQRKARLDRDSMVLIQPSVESTIRDYLKTRFDGQLVSPREPLFAGAVRRRGT